MEIIFILRSQCFVFVFLLPPPRLPLDPRSLKKKDQFIWDWSIVWPCTNNFLGTQVRNSKGEDGLDADKAAGESHVFVSAEELKCLPALCSLGLVFSSPCHNQMLNSSNPNCQEVNGFVKRKTTLAEVT